MEIGEMLKEICKRLSDASSDIENINDEKSYTDEYIERIVDDLVNIAHTDIETALFYLGRLQETKPYDRILDSLINHECIYKSTPHFSMSDMELILQKSNDILEHNISTLKKRIKYCKNPLERKNLQRELNRGYKSRKKGYK